MSTWSGCVRRKSPTWPTTFHLQEVDGPESGDLLVVSWGGTYGACTTAVQQCQQEGLSVAHAHLRYLNPFPKNLGEILKRYQTVLVPELNLGQLRMLLRATYLVEPSV